MNYNNFYNLSCYEEFEMQTTLVGISKIDILKIIGHRIHDYYFFISEDGIFNWFDLEGNHVENPRVLLSLSEEYVPKNITKCIIPDNVKCISTFAFSWCVDLTSITIPDSVTSINDGAFSTCQKLTSITIPSNVSYIGYHVFSYCNSLKEVIFKGKTIEEIKQMRFYYPFGIKNKSIIKCES